MQSTHSENNLLSFFGITRKAQALNKSFANQSLAKSLVGAFFVVLSVSLILNIAVKTVGQPSSTVAATTVIEEKVAYEPGNLVSDEISRGYLGNYR